MCKFQVSTRVIPLDAPSTESIGSRPFLGTRLFTASWGEFVFFFPRSCERPQPDLLFEDGTDHHGLWSGSF